MFNKKALGSKSKILASPVKDVERKKILKVFSFSKNKSGQEEMVGFAIIIVLISVILLAFLGFSLSHSSSEKLPSYEVEGFLYSSLQYTTSCEDNFGYLSIQELIFECYNGDICLNGENSCKILNDSLKGMLEKSWPIYYNDSFYKGYELNIWKEGNSETEDGEVILKLNDGNATREFKWASQDLPKRRNMFHIEFKAYY